MSTHKHIDLICVAVLVCTLLLTVLFINGQRFGIEILVDGDSEGSTDSAYFTDNDRRGDWGVTGATRITLKGDSASVSGGGAYVYDGDVIIAQSGRYVVSGTLADGSIIVNADDKSKVWILLNGAEISCSDDACLRVDQADKVFLTLAPDTANSMTSGAAFSEAAVADMRGGTISSRDDLTVNGSGSLRVTAAYKHGVDVNDELVITGGTISVEAPQDAIHVNDGFRFEEAELTLSAGDEGIRLQGADSLLVVCSGAIDIQSTGSGISCTHDLLAEGGTLSISAKADAVQCAGNAFVGDALLSLEAGDEGINLQSADTTLTLNAGAVTIQSTGAGIKCAGDLLVQDGTLDITSAADAIQCVGAAAIEGGKLTLSADDDGVHSDSTIKISGGSLFISDCYEGVEALTIDVSGGEIDIRCRDDGMNANGGSGGFPGAFGPPTETKGGSEEETWIRISGGSVTVVNETARDADGLDSNGDIRISGGTVRISLSSGGSNSAIDYGSESGAVCEVSGGEIVACGSSAMAEGFSDTSTQCAILYNISSAAKAGTTVSVLDAEGREILSYTPPCSFSSVSLSSPELKQGETYTIVIGDLEDEITLGEISAAYGDIRSGGFFGNMNWGGLRERRPGGGEQPEGTNQRPGPPDSSNRPAPPDGRGGPPDFGGMQPPPDGEDGPPDFGGMQPPPDGRGGPPDFGGMQPPPDGEDGPPDFSGMQPPPDEESETPDFSGMQPPPDEESETPDASDMPAPSEPEGGEAAAEEQSEAETVADETLATGPRPVSREAWNMLAACALVLAAGILFAVKYKR